MEAAAPLAAALPPMLEGCRPYSRPCRRPNRKRPSPLIKRSLQAADSEVAAALRASTAGTEPTWSHSSDDFPEAPATSSNWQWGKDALPSATPRSRQPPPSAPDPRFADSHLSDDLPEASATSSTWRSGKDGLIPSTPRSRGMNTTWSSTASLSLVWRGQACVHELAFMPDAVALGGHLRFADSSRVIARGDFLEGLGELREDHRELAEYRWDISRETGCIHRQRAHKRAVWRRQQQVRASHRAAEAEAAVEADLEEAPPLPEERQPDLERRGSSAASDASGKGCSSSSVASLSHHSGSFSAVLGVPGPQEAGATPHAIRSSRGSAFRHSGLNMERRTSGSNHSSGGAPPTSARRGSGTGSQAPDLSARRRSSCSATGGGGGGDSASVQAKEDFTALRRAALVHEEGLFEEPEMKCILKKLKLKTGREKRLQRLSALQCSYVQQSRLARLKDLRHRDFDALPASERRALRVAFEEADSDDMGVLSARQLKSAVRSLGLRARNDVERTEVTLLCNEVAIFGDVDFLGFCFETVPRIRERLRELRRPDLAQHVLLYDEEDTGFLNADQCTIVFERLLWDLDTEGAKHVRKCFEEKMKKVRDSSTGQVAFEDFEILISEVREQVERLTKEGEALVERKEKLDEADMKAHRDELLQLHESFRRAATEHGRLHRKKIVALLMDHGLCPPDASVQEKLEHIIEAWCEEAGALDGLVGFKHFLQAVRFMREMIVSGNHFELSQMFTRLDKSRRGCLNFVTIVGLLDGMGVVPRHLEDQAEIRRLLAEANNGSGEVEFPEFERLVLKVKERIKAAQRFRAAKAAMELRLKDSEADLLRERFNMADVDGLGEITVEKLDQVMEQMNRPVALEDKEAILARLVGDGPQFIDMEKFIRYARAAAAFAPAKS